MCVGCTKLNRACPKDSYLLPNIDKLVDNFDGYKLLSFMDMYFTYNQIPMHEEDTNKIAFMIEHANYKYNIMVFTLRNVGETFSKDDEHDLRGRDWRSAGGIHG